MPNLMKGAVLPPGEKIAYEGTEIAVTVMEVHPENGYDPDGSPRASENIVALVKGPEDIVKNIQCKDAKDLTVKICDFVGRIFDVGELLPKAVLTDVAKGQTLTMEIK